MPERSGSNGWWDEYGVWNVVGKHVTRDSWPADFRALVDAKVARSTGVDGWKHGPVFITEQAQDEQVDTPAWLTGLTLFPFPEGAEELVAEIGLDAAKLFAKIARLKGMYE